MTGNEPQATELLTIAEIAKRLEIPESTVRYYRDKYPAFVPSIGTGRGRRYPAEAVAVLRFIADGLRNGIPPEAVEEGLRAHFPVLVQDDTDRNEPQTVAAATQQWSLAIQQQQAAVMREVIQDALRELLEEQAATFREEISTLREQVGELTAQLERREAQQQRSSSERERAAEARAERIDTQLTEIRKAMEAREQEANQKPWWKVW